MSAKRISSDTIMYGLSQIIERGISFFLLPILTKIVSVSEYAIWSQSVVVAGVMTPILLLGFQTALIKYWPAWRMLERQNSMMFMMLCGITTMIVMSSAIMIIFNHQIAEFIYGAPEYAPYIFILIGMIAAEALFEFMVGVLRANGLINKVSAYVVLKGGLRALVFLTMLYLASAGFYVAFSVFVVSQLTLIMVIYKINISWRELRASKLSDSRNEWVDILKFSMPLVALGLLIAVNNFTDRFFLTNIYGLHDVAAYSAAYSLVTIITFAYSVLGFIVFPVLSRHMAEENHKSAGETVSQTVLIYFYFFAPFIIGVTFVGPDLIQLLTTKAYGLSWYIFLLMGCSIGFFGLYQISFYIILLAYGSMPNLSLMIIIVLLNIMLNSILIPSQGVLGAAIAGCISNGVLAIMTLRLALKAVPWVFKWIDWIRILLQAISMLMVLWSGKILIGFNDPISLIGIILFCMIFYITLDCVHNQNSIIKLLRKS